MTGLPASKKEFNTYQQYYNFCKAHKEDRFIFEDFVQPEIQYLSDVYYKTPIEDMEVPELLIYSIDIEVYSEYGMPN